MMEAYVEQGMILKRKVVTHKDVVIQHIQNMEIIGVGQDVVHHAEEEHELTRDRQQVIPTMMTVSAVRGQTQRQNNATHIVVVQ